MSDVLLWQAAHTDFPGECLYCCAMNGTKPLAASGSARMRDRTLCMWLVVGHWQCVFNRCRIACWSSACADNAVSAVQGVRQRLLYCSCMACLSTSCHDSHTSSYSDVCTSCLYQVCSHFLIYIAQSCLTYQCDSQAVKHCWQVACRFSAPCCTLASAASTCLTWHTASVCELCACNNCPALCRLCIGS